jgi:hypothetical protein
VEDLTFKENGWIGRPMKNIVDETGEIIAGNG